jgi:Flp pilus assembly protein TadG
MSRDRTRPGAHRLVRGANHLVARKGSSVERGTAVVGTLVGFLIFIVLLLFSAQLIIRMYATSALTSAATGAAESVAESPDPQARVAAAEESARSQLGTYGSTRTTFVWKEVDAQQIVLEVEGTSPGFLPLPAAWRTIDRTVTIRTERFR